jgi:hypothetical protein
VTIEIESGLETLRLQDGRLRFLGPRALVSATTATSSVTQHPMNMLTFSIGQDEAQLARGGTEVFTVMLET